jgi:Flp pilus assembly protein TadB
MEKRRSRREDSMGRFLLVSGLVLLLLWVLGLISSFTFNGGIHVLLVVGIILLIVWVIVGRRRGL